MLFVNDPFKPLRNNAFRGDSGGGFEVWNTLAYSWKWPFRINNLQTQKRCF